MATDASCSTCGARHELFFAFLVPAPDYWLGLTDAQRAAGHLDSDLCRIPGGPYFLRGLVVLPVFPEGEFDLGVWISLSEASYRRTLAVYEQPGREHEPPMFGWLANGLAQIYTPSALNLRANVHTQPVRVRPLVELEPTDHPLAIEQRTGITLDRVRQLNERLLHPVPG